MSTINPLQKNKSQQKDRIRRFTQIFLEKASFLQSASLFYGASKGTVYALVFLLPLFFLPGIPNVLDFSKQLLLVALSLSGILFWFIAMFKKEEIVLRLHLLYIPLIFLLLAWGGSTMFSYSRYGSFWGWPLQVSESFLTLFSFAIFFFLVHQLFSRKEEILLLFLILLVSGGIVSLLGILQMTGRFFLPFDFTKTVDFNTIGSPATLAVFAAVLLLPAGKLFSAFALWQIRAILALAALAFLVVLLFVNNWTAWAILFVASLVFLVFSLVGRRPINVSSIVLAIFLAVFSSLFFLLKAPFLNISRVLPEVYLTHRATIQMNLEALKQRPLVGTGPGTFLFNYTKFRHQDVNQTIFWDIRFRSGASKISDSFGTGGVFGGSAFIVLTGLVLFCFWKKRAKEDSEEILFNVFASAAVGSIAALFLTWNTMSLFLLFWLFAAMGAVVSQDPEKERRIPVTPQREAQEFPSSLYSLAFSFAFVVAVIFGAGLLYLGVMRFAAEVSYQDALEKFSQGNLEDATKALSLAIQRNQNQDTYWRDLAQVYLARIQYETQGAESAEQIRQRIASFVSLAITSAKRATELEPQNVANWIVRGFIYQNLIGSVEGADNAALNFGYERARELDPVNPYINTQIGRVYLQKTLLARQQAQSEDVVLENVNRAEEHLRRAIELKRDFAPAHFQLAVSAQLRGNTTEAIQKLEEIKTIAPFDAGLAFQLGALYYQTQQFDKAKAEFERAVSYNENYSNARYFLGLLYEKEGRRQEAIQEFERIEVLNPDNQDVKRILANLRANRPPLEGIVQQQPPQTPVEEGRPEEIR